MWRICGFVFIIASIIANHHAYGASGYDVAQQKIIEYSSDAAPQDAHYDIPDTDMPFISINTDMRRDLNWAAALEFSDPALRPMPVVIPFLEDYPFDNLEIKLRVLNLKF